jgi:hypothetical protein
MYTKAKVWALSACLAVILFCSLGAVAQAVVDPTGVLWDLQVTGYAVVGSGYMEFYGDNTLFGYLIIKPNMALKPYQRPAEVHFGFFVVQGEWAFDAKGRVIGFFSGGSQAVPLDISSFTATVTAPPKARINISATSNNGTMHFSGAPENLSLPDLTGSSWTATVLKNKVRSSEFFNLTGIFVACLDVPLPVDPNPCVNTVPLPYVYGLAGDGASTVLDGAAMLNGTNRVSINLEEFDIDKDTGLPETDGNIRSVTGKVNFTKKTASMDGTDEAKANVKVTATYVP